MKIAKRLRSLGVKLGVLKERKTEDDFESNWNGGMEGFQVA